MLGHSILDLIVIALLLALIYSYSVIGIWTAFQKKEDRLFWAIVFLTFFFLGALLAYPLAADYLIL